jgi:hypothetical protein
LFFAITLVNARSAPQLTGHFVARALPSSRWWIGISKSKRKAEKAEAKTRAASNIAGHCAENLSSSERFRPVPAVLALRFFLARHSSLAPRVLYNRLYFHQHRERAVVTRFVFINIARSL